MVIIEYPRYKAQNAIHSKLNIPNWKPFPRKKNHSNNLVQKVNNQLTLIGWEPKKYLFISNWNKKIHQILQFFLNHIILQISNIFSVGAKIMGPYSPMGGRQSRRPWSISFRIWTISSMATVFIFFLINQRLFDAVRRSPPSRTTTIPFHSRIIWIPVLAREYNFPAN